MFFLLLHIIFGSAFILCLKWVQNRGTEEVITVGCINYIVAAIAMTPVVFSQTSPTDLNLTASSLGVANGVSYFIAFFFVIYLIKRIGVSSSTVVGVLSMLIPIGVAAMLWNENPTIFQWIGVVLAMISLSLVGENTKEETDRVIAPDKPVSDETAQASSLVKIAALVIFFLLCGLSRLAQEALGHMCDSDNQQLKWQYLWVTFLVAAIPSIVVLIYRKRKISWSELGFGIGLGMSNLIQVLFILQALKNLEGYIVFPIASAGGLILTTLVATQLLGEKLSKITYVGISLATLALILLKLKF